MHNLIYMFEVSPKYAFYIISGSIVFLLFALCLVNRSNEKLVTTEAPYRIVSLEIAWSSGTAESIKKSWEENNLTKTALTSIDNDYLLILAYTIFLVLCVLVRNDNVKASKRARLLLIACLVAALLDGTENIFMTRYLEGHAVSPVLFALPATIKFALLVIVIVSFVKLDFFSRLLKALYLYFPGILFVLISYYLFIRVAPGQDVVIQIGEYSGPFIWTMICVVLWAIFSWYSSRVVGYQKSAHDDLITDDMHLHIPRLIAFNALVSIQAAILSLPTIGRLDQCELWSFVIVQNLFYFVWHYTVTASKDKGIPFTITLIVVLAYGIYIISLVDGTTPHQQWLPLIALALFCFELFLLRAFIRRRKEIQTSATGSQTVQIRLFNKTIDLPVLLPEAEKSSFRKFNIAALAGVVLYFAGFFSMWLTDRMGPLAFTLLAFGIFVGLANILSVLSIFKRVNFFFILFMLALLVGKIYDPFKVRILTNAERNISVPERPDLKTSFSNWLKDKRRRNLVAADTGVFPVYVVISDGGASRSGYWVASVLSALQDESIKKNPNNTFADHLLCLAGASGGSVGTATFYALLKNQKPANSTFLKRSRAFLKEDFLTPVITHWLGSDLVQHIIPMPFLGDRAVALEQAMEYFAKDSLYEAFKEPFRQITHDPDGRLPMLFINTTHVQQGAPAVVSSVRLSSKEVKFSSRLDVLDSVGTESDLRYSTAVVLGARFPFVSPAGSIKNDYFADGGYFDNTGAGIVHEMLQALDSLYRSRVFSYDDSVSFSKLQFRLIYLSNSSLKVTPSEEIHPVINDAAAPILTVLGTYASQTTVNNQRLLSFMNKLDRKAPMFEINLYTKTDSVDYPMNWVISEL